MKVWYDVSGLYNWRGNFTGIQRIVYNLGKELQQTRNDVGFFIYHRSAFHEVLFSEIEERLKKSSVVESNKREQDKNSSNGKMAFRHHTLVWAKSITRGSALEAPARWVYSKSREVYRGTEGSSRYAPSLKHKFFGQNDTVIIVDGNWLFSGYAEALMRENRRVGGINIIHFVHDLAALKNPALANPGADEIIGSYFRKVFPIATKLIAISQSTARDIRWVSEQWGIKPPHTEVLILADNSVEGKSSKQRNATRPQSAPDSFILTVGTIEVRKNHMALYYAYKYAHEQGLELPHLVVAGKKGWMAEEVYSLLTKDSDLTDKVTIIDRPSDPELGWLYRNCMFSVFPSFYEGWGLPVAESFMYGKVCVSSDATSMGEVGGDLAVYMSPYDTKGLAQTIHKLAKDKTELLKLETKIKNHYQPRSWKQVTDDFKKIAGL